MKVEEANKYLRLPDTEFDVEVSDLLDAAVLDMKNKGVKASLLSNPDKLVEMAIITFVKANFGYEDIATSEKLKASYEEQVSILTMSKAYREAIQ